MALVGWGLWRRGDDGASGWRKLIRPELLVHLLEASPGKARRWPLLALLLAWVLAVVALAGPTWEQLPQPVYRGQQAQVLILDLSPSMAAGDLKPSRLVHARHRLIDLIKAREEGLTGLVVYSGDAHVVAPLSHDQRTLLALAPTLSPELMPALGSRVEAAVEQALQLLQGGRHGSGDLVLITDGIAPEALVTVRERLAGSPYRLSILGVGSVAGAPVPLADGRLARDSQGKLLLARLNRQELATLARDSGGFYRDLAADGSDVAALVEQLQRPLVGASDEAELARSFDRWAEAGPWLVLLLLPLAALAHRRGLLLLVLLVPLGLPEPAYALEWEDLWLTPDQQGARALARGEPETAASLFEDPRRQGQALYQSEVYPAAAERFATAANEQSGSANHYNHGNALARAGKLEEALAAYDRALELDPALSDARHNRALVEELLKQQSESEESGEGGEEGEEGDPQDDSSGQSDSSEGDEGEGQGEDDREPSDASGQGKDGEGSDREGSKGESPPSDAGEGDSEPPPSGGEAPASSEAAESDSENEPSDEAPTPAEASPAPREEGAAAGQPATSGSEGEESDPVLERWLRQLPEDPGGLLRRKFAYQYQQRAREATPETMPETMPETGPEAQRW